jgi:hypothetical protein
VTKGISAAQMNNDLEEIKVQFRGTLYVLRELPMDEYDKTVAMATKIDPETKEEIFDGTAHTKILLAKSLVEPKISAAELYAKGTKLVRGLQQQLQKLYWSSEPDELKILDDESAKMASKLGDDDDEGEAEAALS